MTLIHEFNLAIVKTYLHTRDKFLSQSSRKLEHCAYTRSRTLPRCGKNMCKGRHWRQPNSHWHEIQDDSAHCKQSEMEPVYEETDGKFLIQCVCSAIQGSQVCWIRCQHSLVPDTACTTNRFAPTAGSWNCPCGNRAVGTPRSRQPSSNYKQRQINKPVIKRQKQQQFIITHSETAVFPTEKEFKIVPHNAARGSKGPSWLFWTRWISFGWWHRRWQ